MPRTEDENQRIRESQRAAILKAAKAVFARKGWSTTIADIAAAAKVSPGLIYHYFSNKEAIFQELIGQTMQSDPSLFQNIAQSGDTAKQRLESLLSTILKTRHDYINQIGITTQVAKPYPTSGNNVEMMQRMLQKLQYKDSDTTDLQELMLKRFQSIYDIILQLIIEGQKEGEFAQDSPSKLALMIFTCIQGLTNLALSQPDEYEQNYPYADIMMRMLKPDH